MIYYEIKKVFSKKSNQIAVLLLCLIVGLVCWFAMDVSYVNENGEKQKGYEAVSALRATQKEWAGVLDEEKIRQVIAENTRIVNSKEYQSDDLTEQEISYSHRQQIQGIRELLNYAYADDFRDYNYYKADELTEADAPQFYDRRTLLLKEWLYGEADDQFSERQKEYLLNQYENTKTPWYYDWLIGWSQLIEYAPTIVMITMLILGYLSAGIFSNEFAWKADAVYFTSFYGRNRASAAKIKAGVLIVTGLYFAVMLVYTGVVLLYLGADGWACPIQAAWFGWKSFYNIAVWQAYLLTVLGGYLGCLFIAVLCMFISAKTKSAVIAVTVPFVLLFIPSFLGNVNSPAVSKVIALLPDQLLQMAVTLGYFNLYSVGGQVVGSVPILMVLYTALTVIGIPVTYQVYRHKQIV